MIYTLKSVKPAEQFSSQYGLMQVYSVEFHEYNGYVNLNQKASTPAPLVGSQLEGEITRDQRGNPKFKKAYNPAARPSTGGAVPTPTSSDSKRDNGEGAAWGNSLTNAVTLHAAMIAAKKADIEGVEDRIVETARYFFENRPGNDQITKANLGQFSDGTPIPEPKGEDVIPTDIPEQGVNLDDIPF